MHWAKCMVHYSGSLGLETRAPEGNPCRHMENIQTPHFRLGPNTLHSWAEAIVLIAEPQRCPWANLSHLFIHCLYTWFACSPTYLHFFSCPLSSLQNPKSKGIWRQQRWENNREIMPEIYLHSEPVLKSYREACNRDWFWSADLSHPVWKKYWQSILHWLKIIATVPLPCSNLPLDHSRQGHRVHYTRWSEGGNGGHWDVWTRNKELL